MADIVDPKTRSRMMSGIRGKDTKPELVVRRLLHRNGFRFRLHRRDLPGTPDLVLARYNTAIFINGCYWHGHEDCELFRTPKTRSEFWSVKINGNRERDRKNRQKLLEAGWNVIDVWECAVTKKRRLPLEQLRERLCAAICLQDGYTEIRS